MTNEEKAKQITNEVFVMDAIIGVDTSKKIAEICCRKMAQWKEQQMIEKACEWLESVNLDYYQIREGVFSRELVVDFRKTMEE